MVPESLLDLRFDSISLYHGMNKPLSCRAANGNSSLEQGCPSNKQIKSDLQIWVFGPRKGPDLGV